MNDDHASTPFALPGPLEELRQWLSGSWRHYPSEDRDVVVDETCQASSRGPFLETLVETKIRGHVVHRVRGGFAWNSRRQALVTWSKEGDLLRHLGYQKATSEDGLAFECRFPQAGDQDVLIFRVSRSGNLEIRRVTTGDRATFVRLEDPGSATAGIGAVGLVPDPMRVLPERGLGRRGEVRRAGPCLAGSGLRHDKYY